MVVLTTTLTPGALLGELNESSKCSPKGPVTSAVAVGEPVPVIVRCSRTLARNWTGVPFARVFEVIVIVSLHCPCALALAPPAGPVELAMIVAEPCTAPSSVNTLAVASKV